MDSTSISVILWGLFGGVLSEFLHLYNFREVALAKLPRYFKSPFYWLMTFGMIAVGGFLPWLYLIYGYKISGILAVQIGASAPLIIGKFISKEPKIDN